MRKEMIEGRCNALVIALVGKELSEKWWDSPNKFWNGKTPRSVFDHDYMDVYNYLMYHADPGF
jgi:hypothetical protein